MEDEIMQICNTVNHTQCAISLQNMKREIYRELTSIIIHQHRGSARKCSKKWHKYQAWTIVSA